MQSLPYSKQIIEHFKKPRNMGRIKNPDAIGEAGNLVCVLPQTYIWNNNKLIPIEEIKEENFVLSHTGNYEKIIRIHKRNYKGKLIKIKNRLGSVFLTPDHLIFAIKVPKTNFFLRTENKKKLPIAWYHVKELEVGDILVLPIPKEERDVESIPLEIKKFKYDFRSKILPSSIKINEKFLRLAGYFLAEGHANTKITQSLITFTLNAKEDEIARDIKNITKELFNLDAKISKRENKINVFIHSVPLSRFFKRLFGENAKTKHIPHFMMILPKEKQKHLIYGVWKGDGYINLKRKNPRGGFATISHQLAQQIKILLLRQGIKLSLYEEKEKVRKGVYHQASYRIHVGDKESLIKLCNILGINWNSDKHIQKKSWIENGYFYTPATKMEMINYKGIVMNLEVKNSKSFVTNCATLHNCGDVMRLYLKIGEKKGKRIIKDIKFETFGCIVAIANSSILTTMVKGKTLEEVIKIKKEDLTKKLGKPLPPIKIHCSILALDALHEAIYNYYKSKSLPIPKELEKRHEIIQKTLKDIEKRHKEFLEMEKKML